MLEAEAEAADVTRPTREAWAQLDRHQPAGSADASRWIRGLVATHFDFIWRSLRRLGVPEADVDDATQKVFCVALRRANDVLAGSERSFLFSTAMHIAADVRRARWRAGEVFDERALEQVADPMSNPEELADQKRARQMLDEALDAMDLDLRTVFVLCELEELTAPEIATLLELPLGTVASRLRRARKAFRAIVTRIQRARPGGVLTHHRSENSRGGGR